VEADWTQPDEIEVALDLTKGQASAQLDAPSDESSEGIESMIRDADEIPEAAAAESALTNA